ncbi:MAG: ABC transporter ATP-binding protein [Mycoplasmatales bacterium]
MAKIEINNLTKVFENKNRAFRAVEEINFTVNSGEIVTLLGPNGAGKTTIIKMIVGILTPTSGEIIINNSAAQQSKQFGIAFGGDQGFYNQASALENLQFFAKLAKIDKQELKKQIPDVLKQVDLFDNRHQMVGEFSRGMKQRLHLARALLGEPDILLLDEPTIGLDLEIAHQIREIILKLKSKEKCILLTSHVLNDIETLSDKIILLGNGKIKFIGSIAEVIAFISEELRMKFDDLESAYIAYSSILQRKND